MWRSEKVRGGENEERQTRMEASVSGLDLEKGRLSEERRRVGMQ
jgi:hypothetical protein